MYIFFIGVTIFSTVVHSDPSDDVINFSQDRKSLSECLKNHSSLKSLQSFLDEKLKASIIETISPEFDGFSGTIEEFDSTLGSWVEDFGEKYASNNESEMPWMYFMMSLREALTDCSENMVGQRFDLAEERNENSPSKCSSLGR